MTESEARPEELGDEFRAASALNQTSRWLCAAIGCAAGTAGAVALFVSTNDIGSGVMLAVGALFLLMAATGHPVTSAKLGNNEIRLARRVIRDVIESAPEDVRPELAEVVIESDLPPNDPLRKTASRIVAAVDSSEYAKAVIDALDRIGFVPSDRALWEPNVGVDAVGSYDDTTVGVETKAGWNPLDSTAVALAIRRSLKFVDRVAPPTGVLLVTRGGLTGQALRSLERGPDFPMRAATWRSSDDDAQLREALESLASAARARDARP